MSEMVMQIRGGSLKVEIVDKIQFEVHSHFKTTFCPSNFGHTEQKQSGTFLSLCNLRNNISMAQSARHVISSNILEMLPASKRIAANLLKINSSIEMRKIRNNDQPSPQLHLPVNRLLKMFDTTTPMNCDQIQNAFPDCIQTSKEIIFPIADKDQFVHNALREQHVLQQAAHRHKQRIVVEFSSPNIAKPFHVGHLRSTIIGNFVANLFSALNHDVVRLNYLGDWGTQFGLLSIGMNMATTGGDRLTETDLRAQPIRHLYEAYVRANQMAASDEGIANQAREIFLRMENGCGENVEQWQSYRRYTVDELRRVYQRLGVHFDEYHWESDYRRSFIQPQLDRWHQDGLIERDSEGKLVARVVVGGQERCVPFVKSDGSTLYLARDLAAVVDRVQRYRFDRMFYVVDHGQSDHFQTLFAMARKANVAEIAGAEHIKFGRIQGMSTRKGNAIFLKNILDEAQEIMQQRQRQSSTTKIDVDNNETDDILGVSAVIVNDLKQRRQRDYEFDWNKALQMSGDTGIKLQYTHCRLCNLEEMFGNLGAADNDCWRPELLSETEAQNLIFEIAKFSEMIYRSEDTLESCYLVNYLFGLSNSISRALKQLNVKDHPNSEVRQQRMMLFSKSRAILSQGMRILGLIPLSKM